MAAKQLLELPGRFGQTLGRLQILIEKRQRIVAQINVGDGRPGLLGSRGRDVNEPAVQRGGPQRAGKGENARSDGHAHLLSCVVKLVFSASDQEASRTEDYSVIPIGRSRTAR